MDTPTGINPGEGKRLLVVEDDLASCFALRALFARRGWQVSVVRSVAEALDALSPRPPDWMILDLFLPDGDGEEVLRRVREEGLDVRVAVTSGILDPQRAASLRAWKPDILMPKPVDFVRLFSACLGIKSALGGPELADLEPAGYLKLIGARDLRRVVASSG